MSDKYQYLNINHCWGSLIIEELVRCGVEYFCLAPGSRCSPLTVAVAQQKGIRSVVHFDERGLAFHALGYVSAVKKPAVLICTSGTAAANFLPAIIEASKKKLPLIVITADRPPELRQTGAVQTIDQVGLFGKYVKWAFDMPCPDINIKPAVVLTTIDQAYYQALRNSAGVVHLNCMFREPLAPVKSGADLSAYIDGLKSWHKAKGPYTQYAAGVELGVLTDLKNTATRINALKNGLIVVGKIGGLDEQDAVLDFAKHLGWPVFADISSGLRLGHRDTSIVHYFDQILLSPPRVRFDGIVHLGGRITSKRYYDFIESQSPAEYITVLNHALRNDPTHQVSLRVESRPINFCQAIKPMLKTRPASTALKQLRKANVLMDKVIENFFSGDACLSEPKVARLVSQLIPQGSGLFLSNSMPIRDMDFYADFKGQAVYVNGNRGASGIDGLIASAIGYAQGLGKPVTLMVGDLAALYDLNSLAMLRDADVPVIAVVLNNGGGGIFSFLPINQFKGGFEKYWGTPHSYTFANAAAMFELNYAQPQDDAQFTAAYAQAQKSRTSTIIEVITSRDENVRLHQGLQAQLARSIK